MHIDTRLIWRVNEYFTEFNTRSKLFVSVQSAVRRIWYTSLDFSHCFALTTGIICLPSQDDLKSVQMFRKTWNFTVCLKIRKIWDFHVGFVTRVVSVEITGFWRNRLPPYSWYDLKRSGSRFFRKVRTFLADYMASCCGTNVSNLKILLLGLVTLIHNPTSVDLCQKFWRTSTYVTFNAAAFK